MDGTQDDHEVGRTLASIDDMLICPSYFVSAKLANTEQQR